MKLLRYLRRIFHNAGRRNFYYMIVLCGILATLFDLKLFNGTQFLKSESILLALLVMISIGGVIFLEGAFSLLGGYDSLFDFEKRGELIKAKVHDLSDIYWEYNLSSDEVRVSKKFFAMTGYNIDNKEHLTEIYNTKLFQEDKEKLADGLNKYLDEKKPILECDFRLLISEGKYSWFNIKAIKHKNIKGEDVISGILSDISSRKNIEDKIYFMAYYDSLTGLPNKTLFINHLSSEMDKSKDDIINMALVLIDIDDFKNVNDTLGHHYGDQLLKIIAELLRITLEDTYMISRAGGDEYYILINDYDGVEDITKVCEDITGMLTNPIEIGEKSLYVTISIGIAFYDRSCPDSSTLIKNAETAMYRSKETGKNKFSFYDCKMGQILERKMKIGNLLREAIFRNELSIAYQPQYAIRSNEIIGIEALIRWNNGELGNISPAEFINIAEGNGLIVSIGKWVIEEVCRQCRIWKLQGYEYGSVAINISAIQLQEQDFVAHIKNEIVNNGISSSSIEIEITESLLLGNKELSQRKLQELKNFGVKIAIDDFGTGYSSLNYLTFLPLDTLKIDKSFIDKITIANVDRILAQNIIKLSHDLNIKVIAEGVETKDQLEFLKDMNCDVIQGYYLSKPLTKEMITGELEKMFKSMNGVDKNEY